MAEPASLFDVPTGNMLRDISLTEVEQHADVVWLAAARLAAREVARTRPEFTTDDIWKQIPDGIVTHELRAMGAVTKWMRKQGFAEPTAAYCPTVRPEAHARPVRIWRSLVCDV